jgi:hypothetical protein
MQGKPTRRERVRKCRSPPAGRLPLAPNCRNSPPERGPYALRAPALGSTQVHKTYAVSFDLRVEQRLAGSPLSSRITWVCGVSTSGPVKLRTLYGRDGHLRQLNEDRLVEL